MNTFKTAAAAVLGARHARIPRNGQDAVAVWTSREVAERGDDAGLGGATRDTAVAGAGRDTAVAGAGRDTALAGAGRDTALAGATRDGALAGAGRDTALAGAGRDTALAGATRDGALAGTARDGARAGTARGDTRGRTVDIGANAAVVVVCDGCSSGASSEVGARLGASLFVRAMGHRIAAGASISDRSTWEAARREVVAILADLLERMHRLAAIRDHFLFTIVAAAMTRDGAAVWALGDGVYSFGGTTRELGPFADNEPPYLAYDLLGDAHGAHFETRATDTIIIGTDGATELSGGIERFAAPRFLDHPDALRRELAVLARPHERIDWDERRVIRTPAILQDDCAIGVLRREAP